jgi:hypothetical protein
MSLLMLPSGVRLVRTCRKNCVTDANAMKSWKGNKIDECKRIDIRINSKAIYLTTSMLVLDKEAGHAKLCTVVGQLTGLNQR